LAIELRSTVEMARSPSLRLRSTNRRSTSGTWAHRAPEGPWLHRA